MGSKVTFRPSVAPKARPLTAKVEQCKVEKKMPAAPKANDTFEVKDTADSKTKPSTTHQKIESIWKDGNISSTDDWEKSVK